MTTQDVPNQQENQTQFLVGSIFSVAMAARPGFEPGSRVPETRVLPLHYRALGGQFSVALGVDTGQARVVT